jgi:beta-glucosidase
VTLKPGEKKTVTFTLTGEQLGYYSVTAHDTAFDPGTYEILVGSSSRDIQAEGRLEFRVPGM